MSATVAVVLAPRLGSYPPLPYRGEGALLAARRREPCACGVDIVQRSGEDVVAVVAAHNAHPSHQAWRERRG